jgi:hypothetical protein
MKAVMALSMLHDMLNNIRVQSACSMLLPLINPLQAPGIGQRALAQSGATGLLAMQVGARCQLVRHQPQVPVRPPRKVQVGLC